MIVLGLDLVADFIYVIFLLNGFFIKLTVVTKLLGAIFILARFVHPVVTTFILTNIFGTAIVISIPVIIYHHYH